MRPYPAAHTVEATVTATNEHLRIDSSFVRTFAETGDPARPGRASGECITSQVAENTGVRSRSPDGILMPFSSVDMADDAISGRVLRFGVFEADLASGELRKQGRRLRLQEQPFRILTLLLDRPGQ